MLRSQLEIKFSSHSELYDLLVAKDNKLRQVKEAIDFSFVYDELKDKYCMDNGREAVNPITMFKYLFLKAHSGLSDIDLVERVRTDLSYKYFLDMSPEELPIDSSLLSFFRRKRLKDACLLDALIRETVSVALERGLINRRSDIIVDATHTVSKYTPYNPKDLLKRRSKAFRKALYRYDGSLAGKVEKDHDVKEVADEIAYCKALVLEYGRMMEGGCVNKDLSEAFNSLKESIEDIEERYTTSPSDRDAKAGSKGRGNDFFGYKTHLAETPEGIVTAAVVTSGEQGDGPHAAELVDKTVGNGLEVDALIGDAAYSGKAILEKGAREGFKVVAKLHPAILSGYRKAEPGMEFGFNKDADMPICPAGHTAVRKREIHYAKGKAKGNSCMQYGFDAGKCGLCLLRGRCLKGGAKGRTVSIPIHTAEQEAQKEYQQTEEFKEKYRERYKVEQKNAHLKQHGMDRTESFGIGAMTIQAAMAIFYQNVRTIVRIQGKNEQ